MRFNLQYRFVFSVLLLLLVSCNIESEDCLGNSGGEAQEDDCGVCDIDINNDCIFILTELEGVWVGYELGSNSGEAIWEFVFNMNEFNAYGENDQNMTGGTNLSQSYGGVFSINETIYEYNEINIYINQSDFSGNVQDSFLGLYIISNNTLKLAYGSIRPEESVLNGDTTNNTGIRLFNLTKN